jgi:hypothetical protein
VLEATVLMAGLAVAPLLFFLRDHAYNPSALQLLVPAVAVATAWVLARVTAEHPVARAVLVAAIVTLFVDLAFDIDTPVPGLGASKLLAGIFLIVFALQYFLAAPSTRIGAAVAAAMTAAILVSPTNAAVVDAGVRKTPRSTSPLLVHIILDEHMGIEGLMRRPLTAGMAGDVRDWFETRGFQVFGGAYSQDFASEVSLGRVLNFRGDHREDDTIRFTDGLFESALPENAYFDRLAARGYALQVLQTSFVNLCPSPAGECRTYDVWKLGTPRFAALAPAIRFDVIKLLLLRQSEIWADLLRARSVVQNELQLVSPLSAMDMLDDLEERLRQAKRGDAIFAHVPAPHSPYVYDAGCAIRPTKDWLDMNDPGAPFGAVNTAAGQELRYGRYVEQLRCVLQRLDGTLKALPEELASDAIVVVHGDHGSRISEYHPSNTRTASEADYVDVYSTLFAIRAPGAKPGYRSEQVSLACLFRGFADASFAGVPDISRCSPSETVYVKREGELLPVGTMPAFAEAP